MTDYDITRKSRPIVITAYDDAWPGEYRQIALQIRTAVGAAALRIDHIGSTAVPGLAGKDVIDIQVTAPNLNNAGAITKPLRAVGFRQGDKFVYDEFRNKEATDPELRKLYMREREGERRVHVHIREHGRLNQRYALVVRDYLRVSARVRQEYEILKRRAAHVFHDSIDGYLYLKDPVFHIIYEAAIQWAEVAGWAPDEQWI